MTDNYSDSLSIVMSHLPEKIKNCLSNVDTGTKQKITNIYLRANSACTLSVMGENYVFTKYGISKSSPDFIRISDSDIDTFIYSICKGSVYSHEKTLSEGFIIFKGIRIGVGGVFNTRDGKISGLKKIKSVNIRLCRHVENSADHLFSYIKNFGFPSSKGILILSPPGVGKTTLLRSLSKKLSTTHPLQNNEAFYRVCVIDERCEIYMENVFSDCHCDFLVDIPKAKGMEIATRVLCPEIIICDEISSESEATEILRGQNTGVIFIASAHAQNPKSALCRPFIKELVDGGVFGAFYTLSRVGDIITGNLSFPEKASFP